MTDGTLTIDPTPLTVTPADQSKVYGNTFTDFTGAITGLKNDDAITASYSSTGSAASAPAFGSPYDITATLADPDGKLGNCTFTLNTGHMTVTGAADHHR